MEQNPVIIIGTGAEARIALDIFNMNDVLAYGFITDDPEKIRADLNDVSVFGTLEDEDVITVLKDSKVDYIVAEGDIERRKKFQTKAAEISGRPSLNVSHPAASISEYAKLGTGNIFAAGVCLNPNVALGSMVVIQSLASVEPDTEIGDYCTIGAGARIGGNVKIADEVFIGTGAVIYPGVKIGKGAIIGAGSVVIQDVEKKRRVFGNPAAEISGK